MVFTIKLVRPNSPPKTAPDFHPSKIEPKMTGMWIVVALMTPSGIYPSGVKDSTTMIPENSASFTMSCVFLLA